jgi:hypothetical protein
VIHNNSLLRNKSRKNPKKQNRANPQNPKKERPHNRSFKERRVAIFQPPFSSYHGVMMYIIKPSVKKLTEEEIRTALNSRDEDNLIVVEFGLVLRDLIEECTRLKKEKGNINKLLGTPPSCAMEKVALELLAEMTTVGSAAGRKTTPVFEKETQ